MGFFFFSLSLLFLMRKGGLSSAFYIRRWVGKELWIFFFRPFFFLKKKKILLELL
jgi:hypothetical protein